MRQALLDTSFVIALARGEQIEITEPPEEAAISAVTLCGLHHAGDGLIAATAAAHSLPLLTRDRGFQGLSGVEVVLV